MSYKVICSAEEATALIHDGASVMVGGHGTVGVPHHLIKALLDRAISGLTLLTNALQLGAPQLYDATCFLERGMVRRLITSMTVPKLDGRSSAKVSMEVELVPQGTLIERVRAGGAGLAGFFVHTGVGTPFADGKEACDFDGQECILEMPMKADFALIRAHKADLLGNLVYSGLQRNCNPIMATAATTTIVEVDEVVEVGQLDPEMVITPGIYVHRIVLRKARNL